METQWERMLFEVNDRDEATRHRALLYLAARSPELVQEALTFAKFSRLQ